MTYENLYLQFKSLFPSDYENIKFLEKNANVDETDGIHVLFSFVVIPFVLELIKNNNEKKLNIIFDYFESMASSDVTAINEVVEFTVVENLMSNGKNVFETSKKFMGKHMIECCENVAKYMNVADF